MNEPKTQLPGFVLADLYRNSLVIPDDAVIQEHTLTKDVKSSPGQVAVPEKPSRKQWYLGDNGKQILIIVNDPDAVFLNDESLQFLSTILAACKLNLGDVAIVNLYREPLLFSFLKKNLSPRYALIFHVSLQQLQLPFTVPHYQVQQYDQCQFLTAPSLQTMLGNDADAKLEKSRLWLSLKKMFNL